MQITFLTDCFYFNIEFQTDYNYCKQIIEYKLVNVGSRLL